MTTLVQKIMSKRRYHKSEICQEANKDDQNSNNMAEWTQSLQGA